MRELVDDWSKLVIHEITPRDFANKHWEKFRKVYCASNKHYDDGALYIELSKCLERAYNNDINPVFEDDLQIYTYFRVAFKNNFLHSLEKVKDDVSLDKLSELGILPADPTNIINNTINTIDLDILLRQLDEELPESLMKAIILLLRGYSRKESAAMLGISLQSFNDRIWRAKQIIYKYCR